MKMIELHRGNEPYLLNINIIAAVAKKEDHSIIYIVSGKYYFEADESYDDVIKMITACG